MNNITIEKHNKHIGKVSQRYVPMVITRGEGAYLYDDKGKKYLDFTSGMAANALGHSYPGIVEKIREQAGKLIHAGARVGYYESQIALAEKLKKICPGMAEDGQVVFANSGSEAIENALKLARSATKKPMIISFLGAFHGRTLGATSVTASKSNYRIASETLVNGTIQIPYPGHSNFSTDQIIDLLKLYFRSTIPVSAVAGILVEPVLGEGGCIIPPKDFMPKLRKLCDEINCLLIVDEIQTGIGRTGKWLAINHYNGIKADVYCLDKAIGGGLPVSAIVAKKDLMDKWAIGLHVGGTFAGNVLGCVAGMELIQTIEAENLLENTTLIGDYLKKGLQKELSNYKIFRSVEGIGLMIGIHLQPSNENIGEFEKNLLEKCYKEGLILTTCGEATLRILPPLNVTKEICDEFIRKISRVLSSYENKS